MRQLRDNGKRVPLTVRLPERTHRRVVRSSQRDLRSLNAQVAYLLDRGLSAEEAEKREGTAA